MSITSTTSTKTTLKDYVSRMPSSQKEIYILSADSLDAAKNSPMLEAFKSRNYEVLFFVDPIDEWVLERLQDYDGKKIRAIDRGEINLDGDVSETEAKQKKADTDAATEKFKPLIETIKKQLDADIKDVRISHRLTESACCLVAEEFGPNAHMERIMKAFNQNAVPTKRILEINPNHPLMVKMLEMTGGSAASSTLTDYIDLIHGEALLSEGSPIKNPTRFTKLLNALMAK